MKDFFYIFAIVALISQGVQLDRMERTIDRLECQQDGLSYCHKMK